MIGRLHDLVTLAGARWAISHLALALTAYLIHTLTMIKLRERLVDEPTLEPLSLPETAHLVALLVLTP